MVILVVCLWHEPDSQLFDTEATETDGNQMPFIACLYHLCVPITSVMKTAGTTWQALSLSFSLSLSLSHPPGRQPIRSNWTLWYNQWFTLFILKPASFWIHVWVRHFHYMCVCVCVRPYSKCLCVSASKCPITMLCADTAPRATGRTWCVWAVHQLLMLECQMHTDIHAFRPHEHNCIFVRSIPYTCAHVYMRPRIDICSFVSRMACDAWMHISALTSATKNDTLWDTEYCSSWYTMNLNVLCPADLIGKICELCPNDVWIKNIYNTYI